MERFSPRIYDEDRKVRMVEDPKGEWVRYVEADSALNVLAAAAQSEQSKMSRYMTKDSRIGVPWRVESPFFNR